MGGGDSGTRVEILLQPVGGTWGTDAYAAAHGGPHVRAGAYSLRNCSSWKPHTRADLTSVTAAQEKDPCQSRRKKVRRKEQQKGITVY